MADLSFFIMMLVQVGYSGMNIASKLAMDSGMNPVIHVAYRQLFASVVIVPFAYFWERNSRPIMSRYIFFLIFLSSLFGVTLNRILYFVGLQHSTPTIACALSNLLPAVTFVLAVPFRLETVGIKTRSGQAKVIGTALCVGGAMLMSFYHGPQLITESGIFYSKDLESMKMATSSSANTSFVLGPLLLIISTLSWGVWFIIQAKMSQLYPAPYSASAMICLLASIECCLTALVMEHQLSAWSLLAPIRAFSSIYAGVVCTALAFCAMAWCIQQKGPIYVAVFSPFLLVVVAILSWVILDEKLNLGTAVGSAFIVLGLYAVLWGKNKETETGR